MGIRSMPANEETERIPLPVVALSRPRRPTHLLAHNAQYVPETARPALPTASRLSPSPRPRLDSDAVFREDRPHSELLSPIRNMSSTGDGVEESLIAICLTCEAHVKDAARDTCLGAVTLATGRRATTVSQLRTCVCVQISRLPTAFTFLTRQGGPINKSQESSVRVSQIVTDGGVARIQKCYEKPRVGIRVHGGAAIGFVFIDFNCSVSMLRQTLHQQLGQYINLHDGSWYQFIDRNSWPVNRDQEASLSVLDILREGSVELTSPVGSPVLTAPPRALGSPDHVDGTVGPGLRYLPPSSEGSTGSMDAPAMSQSMDSLGVKRRRYRDQPWRRPELSASSVPGGGSGGRAGGGRGGGFTRADIGGSATHINRLKVPLRQSSTFVRIKDKEVPRPTNLLEPKQILISYVRAEAAQHALMLKETLILHGYSVYLDVHEIKSGIDWQDALNFAVSNCEVFVPLVTPRYGETVWTNREVKLADVLKKYIVPVSFLDHWPPKCLAIQFATTQYIPWKTKDLIRQEQYAGQVERAQDTRFWEPEHVQHVAEQIGSQVASHAELRELQVTQLSQRVSTLKSCPVSLPDDMAQLAAQDREGAPLVVISIHPQQKSFGAMLKTRLENEGYEVWCSSDLVHPAVNGSGCCEGSGEDGHGDDSTSGRQVLSQEGRLRSIPTLPSVCSDCATGSCFSLMSQISQDSSDLNPIDKERRLQFQRKADEAGVVIFVLSKVFAASKTSKQQVFYCEHRKRVIPLRYEEFCMPGWMSMLIGTGVFEDARAEGFKESLQARVKRCLDPTARAGSENDVNEAKIKCHVQNLRKRIPKGVSVYISGGTRFYHKDSEKICQAIGAHLAHLEDIQIMTGGFFGVGDKVGHSYHSEREKMSKQSNIWHVLPERDDQDRSKQAHQNKDKTFPMVAYGKTVYSGDSVREREVIVSRVFDVCILVEGGPGAAHEAEQFCWNDHVVIPVKVTGGAACGKFNVPDKIFKIPPGVSEEDWRMLDRKLATPDEIGSAVGSIVRSIKERLKLDSPTYTFSVTPLSSPITPGPLTPAPVVTAAGSVTMPTAAAVTSQALMSLPGLTSPGMTSQHSLLSPSMTSLPGLVSPNLASPMGLASPNMTPPPMTPPPITPAQAMTSQPITSPQRRRPSLTKMKTVRLPSQSSFCFTQGQRGIEQDEDANMSAGDAVLTATSLKRSYSQTDL